MSQRVAGDAVAEAIEAFRNGRPVLVRDADDREGETDILYPAGVVDWAAVVRLRTDAGGLPFVALSSSVADAFDLPFLHDLLDHPANDHSDLRYDTHPTFSLTVNHRDSYTGVTDRDRARTMSRLATAAAAPEAFDFAGEFRVPGHVHLLRAAPGLLTERRGHTELAIALAGAADLPPAVAGAEMLDDATGRALSADDARAYARRHDLVYLSGGDLVAELADE